MIDHPTISTSQNASLHHISTCNDCVILLFLCLPGLIVAVSQNATIWPFQKSRVHVDEPSSYLHVKLLDHCRYFVPTQKKTVSISPEHYSMSLFLINNPSIPAPNISVFVISVLRVFWGSPNTPASP
jgi:hypothetical protein